MLVKSFEKLGAKIKKKKLISTNNSSLYNFLKIKFCLDNILEHYQTEENKSVGWFKNYASADGD